MAYCEDLVKNNSNLQTMSDQRTDYYLGTYIILGIGSLVIFPIQDNSSWALQGHGTDHQRWKCSESVYYTHLTLPTTPYV